jgi:oxidoreductase
VDFDNLSQYKQAFQGDVGFICLGTTRKDAGSDQAFTKVDHDYAYECCKLFKESSVKSLMLLTSTGSNESSMFLYPRTKGLLERHVRELGFDHLAIFRPGLLGLEEGDKRGSPRLFENLALRTFAMLGNPKFAVIASSLVAKAMSKIGSTCTEPFKIYEHHDIHTIATASEK